MLQTLSLLGRQAIVSSAPDDYCLQPPSQPHPVGDARLQQVKQAFASPAHRRRRFSSRLVCDRKPPLPVHVQVGSVSSYADPSLPSIARAKSALTKQHRAPESRHGRIASPPHESAIDDSSTARRHELLGKWLLCPGSAHDEPSTTAHLRQRHL